jgi:hypothetical protein
MARNSKPPRSTTPVRVPSPDSRQLADLAALLGLMQSASKISQELDALANEVGGSLEKIAERFGVPFFDVHNTYVRENMRKPKRRRVKKATRAT